ncbi:MAG TPA: ShlB/FhaC/HecB family hemolysin secretion/activation protein [Polaromonas sp.]|nr:ShlB/FhaC/HecB family hemolysin secretion/activation protein [Polaromonas sp.]
MNSSIASSFAAVWLFMLAASACPGVFAQQRQRPDAGTLQEPLRQIPLLPLPGAPQIGLPDAKPAVKAAPSVRITPTAFRFQGNTVFDGDTLAAVVAERINQPTDLTGLQDVASLISKHYRSRGYLLTEAYLPEQAFQATGGTVTIAVIEARIGNVRVRLDGEHGPALFAQGIVSANLPSGALITENMLDKPVLLLRDLAGMDASATVEPGATTGQADVTVTLRPQGLLVDGSVSLDNSGARAAGALRMTTSLNVSNLAGRGDVFSARVQASESYRSELYRVAYGVPVDTTGTRLAVSAAHTRYNLGKQFAALGATGRADVQDISLSRALVRSRASNMYGLVSLEHKKFSDEISMPANESKRRIVSVRLGLLGNFSDETGAGASSSYALGATLGRVKLDAASFGFDQGAGGPQTAGGFKKYNLEFQRTQFFNNPASIHVNFQAQLASKNLASAEKMALGGPTGVRGYPVGEGVGDAGVLLNLETRYQLPAPLTLFGEPVSVAAFYDYGTVKFNQDNTATGGVNRLALGSVGVGVLAGRVNHFLITAYLAWRTTDLSPTTGDPDRAPRAWVTAQKWF